MSYCNFSQAQNVPEVWKLDSKMRYEDRLTP
jgi:hypothetical protein